MIHSLKYRPVIFSMRNINRIFFFDGVVVLFVSNLWPFARNVITKILVLVRK